jgi:hypothetical protein
MRHFIFIAALAASLTAGTVASAQTLGRSHDVTLGFERMFGIHWTSWTQDNGPANDTSDSGIDAGFGWDRTGAYHLPRVAVDFFVIERLSLGGALGFYDHEGDGGDGFILAPRVGYAIDLSQRWAFWPRGGLSYYSEGNYNQVALSAEGQFVFLPQPSWGLMFGPTLDLGLSGERNNDDYREHAMGLTFGGVGIF